MNEYFVYIAKTIKQVFLFCIVVLSLFILIGKINYLIGYLFGTVVSIFYFLFLSYRVKQSANLPVDKAVNYMQIGWLIRLGFLTLILIIFTKIKIINFLSVVIGIFTIQFLFIINSFIIIFKTITMNEKRKI